MIKWECTCGKEVPLRYGRCPSCQASIPQSEKRRIALLEYQVQKENLVKESLEKKRKIYIASYQKYIAKQRVVNLLIIIGLGILILFYGYFTGTDELKYLASKNIGGLIAERADWEAIKHNSLSLARENKEIRDMSYIVDKKTLLKNKNRYDFNIHEAEITKMKAKHSVTFLKSRLVGSKELNDFNIGDFSVIQKRSRFVKEKLEVIIDKGRNFKNEQ